jgi:hypothetical protein
VLPAVGTLRRALAATMIALAGCGGSDERRPPPTTAREPADRADKPPVGWRTIANRTTGFTVAVPRGWSARKRRAATLIRSDDRLLALTIAADRSEPGRELSAREYARRTLEALPGFRRLRAHPGGKIRSPYRTARVESAGTLAAKRRRQLVSVTVFQRPGRVTYAAVAFRNARVRRHAHDRELDRLLSTFRARPPQRSGRGP